MTTTQDEDLKQKMIEEALLILNSVGFLEKQINNKFSELEEASNNKLYKECDLLERQIRALVKKIGRENKNMDIFMAKYRIIVDEKEKLVHSRLLVK